MAPPIFRAEVLGESYVEDPKELMEKSLSINLMTLTNDVKKQNINMRFMINRTEKDKVFCSVTGIGIIPSSIRRLVRKGRKRVDMSLVARTNDGINVRLKPLLLTRKLTKGSVTKAIQKSAAEFIRQTVPKNSYEQLVQDIVSNRFQLGLKDHLKKIYPLRTCEIRQMLIEKQVTQEEKAKEALKGTEAGKDVKAEAKEAVKEEAAKKEEEGNIGEEQAPKPSDEATEKAKTKARKKTVKKEEKAYSKEEASAEKEQ